MGGAGEERVRYNKQEGFGVEGSKECLCPHACLGDSKPLSRVIQGIEWCLRNGARYGEETRMHGD